MTGSRLIARAYVSRCGARVSSFRNSRHSSINSDDFESQRAASADLNAVFTEISQQVRLLDGLVRYRFGAKPELMAAWASARNVEGPFRSKAEPTAESVTPAVIKPAA